ncbi:MAG: MFS transporter [Armatimonadetes bacterium]|nr:MFS transporter [Armatimonadota bacterium]
MALPTSPRSRLLQGLGRNVVVLGLVSLLTDISHEMLYPVVPLFLTTILGTPMTAVGLIEGIAECTASLLKVGSGWYSDRIRRRRPFLFLGYGLSAVSKPLLALAASWHLVLASRLLDRLGKGVRTGARDSLIAASCDSAHRGKAFGLHRAMDTVGAFFGPLLALLLLSQFHTPYRTIFLLAFIPALLGLAALCAVRGTCPRSPTADQPPSSRLEGPHASPADQAGRSIRPAVISPSLRRFLIVYGLFALGNSSDVFLLLRARDLGFSQTLVILVYAFYNLVHALAALPAGWLSDHLGRRAIIIGGFCTFAVVYLGFAFAPHAVVIWPLFALYGFYGAAAEGVAKAHVADLSSPATRGTALGLLQTVQGLLALVASLAAGFLWTHVAPSAPFLYGATCALLAAALFLLLTRRPSP